MVDGDIEEALNLRHMKIHAEHTVGSGNGDQIGDQLGGDRITRLCFSILTGIAIVGNHGGNASGRCPLESVDHNKQLHQVIIDGTAGGLDNEYIGAADGFFDGNGDLAIGKRTDGAASQRQAHSGGDVLRQLFIGIAGEDLDVFSVDTFHDFFYSLLMILIIWSNTKAVCVPEGGGVYGQIFRLAVCHGDSWFSPNGVAKSCKRF